MNSVHVLQLALHEALCVALFWSVFCRSAMASCDTQMPIKLALFCLGIAATVGIGAPFYEWKPDWVTLTMLSGFVAVQVVTAELWRFGMATTLRRSRIA